MQNKKIINNKDLKARLNNYCQINHLNIDIFEIRNKFKKIWRKTKKDFK